MVTSPVVSICVPVYNAEKTIRQCLDSLLAQTFRDVEILIINDGSTDKTKAICEEFVERDKRITLYNKENGGSASARQFALEVLSGQYMCSVDADDYTEPDLVEKMYSVAISEGSDIVMCNSWYEYPNGISKLAYCGKSVFAGNVELINEVLVDKISGALWNKLYKVDFINKNKISFEEGINLGEDFLFFLKALQHPLKLTYLPEPLYHYRRMPGENSYTNKVTLNSYNQMLRIHEWIESNLKESQYGRGIIHNLINVAFAGLRVEDGMTSGYYKKTSTQKLGVISLMREKSLKAMVILWTKIFGYHAGRAIYKLMYKRVYK